MPLLRVGAAVAFVLLAAVPAMAQVAQQPSVPSQARAVPESFTINAIDVVGVSTLPGRDIERLIYPFTGPGRTAQDVEAARKAIQDAYAARGLEAVIVEIPAQDNDLFQQGVVTLQVSEVPVGRVRAVGSKYHAPSVVLAQVPSLKEGVPLDLKALQGDLSNANRQPDRVITPSFKPGLVPGTVDVDLRVESSRPLHGFAELNNDNSPNTTDLRLTAGLRTTNLWQAGHSLSFTYAVAPRNRAESEVFSLSYTAPMIGTPWTLLAYGYKSNSNVAALGGTNVLGNGYQIGVRGIYRLPSTATFQTLSIGVDYKNFEQDIFVAGENVGSAPIQYLPLVLEYSLTREREQSTINFVLGTTMGLRLVKQVNCIEITPNAPCVPVDQFQTREINSFENFVRLNAEVNGTFATQKDFVLALRLAGQVADSHLVTNEQFGIGGLTTLRGYFLSEAVGDDGIVGSTEIRLPSLASSLGEFVDEARGFAFVDAGHVKVRSALPEQKDSFDLVSVGGGVKLRLFNLFTGEFLLGVPLIDGASTKAGKLRATFSAKGEF